MPARERNFILLLGALSLLSCVRPAAQATGSTPAPACVPSTCATLGVGCGQARDGCGGVLECGACRSACTPATCASAGASCGTVSDGCGGTLECGSCGAGQGCGAPGLANVCVRSGAAPTVAWLRTVPERIAALATDPGGNVLVVASGTTGSAPGKLDPDGNTLWWRSVTEGLWLSGLSVAPADGGLLAWGVRTGDGIDLGGAVALRFDAEGASSTGLGHCESGCGVGPFFADPEGNVVSRLGSDEESRIRYARADGQSWSASSQNGPAGAQLPFELSKLALSPTGDILVGAVTEGTGTAWGRSFGAKDGSNLAVLALSPDQTLRWAHELPVTRGTLLRLGAGADGTVVGLGWVSGELTWQDTRVVTSGSGEPQGVLFSFGADGTPRWVRALPPSFALTRGALAVSPTGNIAVAGTVWLDDKHTCAALNVAELDAAGELLWSRVFTPSRCPGSVMHSGLAYAGADLVLGGQGSGAVDFGTGVQGTADGQPWGFVLKLRRP